MKNYVIIGGSSGIGKELAFRLSGSNQVFATYHQREVSSSQHLSYHFLNVMEEKPSFDFLPEVIDGLVYCPGSIVLKPFHRLTATDYTNDYALNVIGAVKTIQAALPRLKLSTEASIVLFSTVAVQSGMPFHSLVASSKGAVEGLCRSLAAELAPTIRVNCIAPSLTATPLAATLINTEEKLNASNQRHPLKRIGTTHDLASMASFLLSQESSWMTGQILHLDGGMSSIK